ncbi:MAG: hypothetical protein ACK4VK_05910 [Aquificaceae bacterium]
MYAIVYNLRETIQRTGFSGETITIEQGHILGYTDFPDQDWLQEKIQAGEVLLIEVDTYKDGYKYDVQNREFVKL